MCRLSDLRSPTCMISGYFDRSIRKGCQCRSSIEGWRATMELVLKPYSFQHLGTFPRKDISVHQRISAVVVCRHHPRENCRRDETRKIEVHSDHESRVHRE